MANPALTFAVEFATDKAKASLQALVPDVIGIVQNVLAPISPSNLVTQIAQQGLGLNSLGSNLVNAGVAAVQNSRFSYLTNAGSQFNAEHSAYDQSLADVRQRASLGMGSSPEMMDNIWRVNYAQANASERDARRFSEKYAPQIAQRDMDTAAAAGTKLRSEYIRMHPQAQESAAFLQELPGAMSDAFSHPLNTIVNYFTGTNR